MSALYRSRFLGQVDGSGCGSGDGPIETPSDPPRPATVTVNPAATSPAVRKAQLAA